MSQSVRRFSIKGGYKADLLWGILAEMGIKPAQAAKKDAEVEFVCTGSQVVDHNATHVMLLVRGEKHTQQACAEKLGYTVIFVDAQGEERDEVKATIADLLYVSGD